MGTTGYTTTHRITGRPRSGRDFAARHDPRRGRRFAIDLLHDFERYLADHGVTLTELSRKEAFAVMKRWTSVFARPSDRLREVRGPRAIEKWLSTTGADRILLYLSARITAFPLSLQSRPCTAHRYAGPAIDLSAFNELEFAIFDPAYSWTLVHTHEDGAFGGPYFIDHVPNPCRHALGT